MAKKYCSECFDLVGEGTRLKIINHLIKKKIQNVGEIKSRFSLTQPTISHHLRVLEKGGLILKEKRGREIYYFLNKKYSCKKCFLLKTSFKV